MSTVPATDADSLGSTTTSCWSLVRRLALIVQRVTFAVLDTAASYDLADAAGALVFVGSLAHVAGPVAVELGQLVLVPTLAPLAAMAKGLGIGIAVTSVFHWMEDTYFDESTRWIGQSFIKANRLHHSKPKAMANNSVFRNVGWRLWLPLAGLNCWLGSLTCITATCHIVVAIWIHRWIHDCHRPRFIQTLMDWHLLPTIDNHKVHHVDDAKGYVIYPSTLDTVLDGIRFWRLIEWCIYKVTGAQPRLHKQSNHKTIALPLSDADDSPSTETTAVVVL